MTNICEQIFQIVEVFLDISRSVTKCVHSCFFLSTLKESLVLNNVRCKLMHKSDMICAFKLLHLTPSVLQIMVIKV